MTSILKENESEKAGGALVWWIAVLPAALLGGLAGSFLARAAQLLASLGGLPNLGNSNWGRFVQVLIAELPAGALFVIVGALTAPRWRIGTAVVLGILWVVLSGTMHVLSQPAPGLWNYVPVGVAAVAAAGGATYVQMKGRVAASRTAGADA
jgi:hypothetical protein